jgi:hypothetical protein
MIRFCLGEDHFGNGNAESRIRSKFPDGAVAIELELDGVQWSIIREFKALPKSYAGRSFSIEELHANKGKLDKDSYREFLAQLKSSTISRGPADHTPDGKVILSWNNLLAWLTRDQEARFQSLYDWRSTRSESGTPKINKDQALYLMRMVLGVVHEKEVTVSDEIANLEKSLFEKQAHCEYLRTEPNRIKQDRESRILEILGQSLNHSADSGSLFGIEQRALQKKEALSAEIKMIETDIQNLSNKIDRYGAVKEQFNQKIDGLLALIKTTEESGILDSNANSSDEVLKFLDQLCPAANIDIRDCDYAKKYLARLQESERKLRIHTPNPSVEQRIETLLVGNEMLAAQKNAADLNYSPEIVI